MKDIAKGFKLIKFKKGENMYKHGDQGSKMYFIVKGVVTIKVPFNLSCKKVIERMLKFRDVSLEKSNSKESRMVEITKEHHDKQHLKQAHE